LTRARLPLLLTLPALPTLLLLLLRAVLPREPLGSGVEPGSATSAAALPGALLLAALALVLVLVVLALTLALLGLALVLPVLAELPVAAGARKGAGPAPPAAAATAVSG
jgi:hypothetical protein